MTVNQKRIWTIRDVVQWTAQDFHRLGFESPRLEAELLVAHALGLDRVGLYVDHHRPLHAKELEAIRELVGRRRAHEPVAYIVGYKEFYGRPFSVDRAVLVPRPETEILVGRAIELLPERTPRRVLDLCTGSGAIALTLAAERPEVVVDACDVSQQAIEVARRNALALGLSSRVHLFVSDLFAAVEPRYLYDLVTCNPPYLAGEHAAELPPDVRDHEPSLALFGGPDGLDVTRAVIDQVSGWLAPAGVLLIELADDQAAPVCDLVRGRTCFAAPSTHRDYSGVERVIEIRLAVA